jgi:hypothetical protein
LQPNTTPTPPHRTRPRVPAQRAAQGARYEPDMVLGGCRRGGQAPRRECARYVYFTGRSRENAARGDSVHVATRMQQNVNAHRATASRGKPPTRRIGCIPGCMQCAPRAQFAYRRDVCFFSLRSFALLLHSIGAACDSFAHAGARAGVPRNGERGLRRRERGRGGRDVSHAPALAPRPRPPRASANVGARENWNELDNKQVRTVRCARRLASGAGRVRWQTADACAHAGGKVSSAPYSCSMRPGSALSLVPALRIHSRSFVHARHRVKRPPIRACPSPVADFAAAQIRPWPLD